MFVKYRSCELILLGSLHAPINSYLSMNLLYHISIKISTALPFLCFPQLNFKGATDSVILLTEYHANSIRLRRVLLLRSYIRLMPSDIRFASFRQIEYHCKAMPCNITSRKGNITLCEAKNITLYEQKKREYFGS